MIRARSSLAFGSRFRRDRWRAAHPVKIPVHNGEMQLCRTISGSIGGWLCGLARCALIGQALLLFVGFGHGRQGISSAREDSAAQQDRAERRLRETLNLLQRLVREKPDNPTYLFDLGDAYMLLGRPEQAIGVLGKCLRIAPGNWQARLALAQAYQKVNQDPDALRTLGQRQPPISMVAFWTFLRAFSLYRLREINDAEPLLRNLLTNGQMEAPAGFFLANCYSEAGRYKDALRYYELAITEGRTAQNKALNLYYYDYGMALWRLGRTGQACDAFEKSIERFAGDPLPWYYLGRCQLKLGHLDRAREAFESATERNASFVPAQYQLARLYMARGDRAEADALYHKISAELRHEFEESQRLKFGNTHPTR
jgi:tetratricopeptide (TPR) repeat protein